MGMAEKRTKSDKEQRQADQLEKKARHPAPKKRKRPARTSVSLPCGSLKKPQAEPGVNRESLGGMRGTK